MRKIAFAAVLLAAGAATPAFARDAADLSGFRVEALGGYETTDIDDEGTDGIAYGVGVGYDMQAGGAVFGIEAEAMDSTVDECVPGSVIASDTLCAKFGRDLYVGGRIGAAVGGNALVYAKGGYTNARIGIDYDDGIAGTTGDFTLNDELDGVRVGGGVQFGLGRSAYAKAEYRYSNYEQGFEKHQGLVGLGFRF
ncbi:MAG TPA: outer membrane beta-barrel protein [Allosphingosinicella sp.]|nr:outer membrane beta-barrel protein [Allosphingosinicella sp.]